jgi:pantetheine-phosphate adenylyltransferase
MTSPRIAVYPGSFDPVTNGHLDVIQRASRLFDRVVVAVGRNSGKSALFSVDERVDLLRETCTDLPNVEAVSFSGMLVEYARSRGASVLIKGLRAISDFEYEFQMALANRHLAPDIETMFLMTSAEYQFLSSSIVKEIARVGGDIGPLVPAVVARRLERWRSEQNLSTS